MTTENLLRICELSALTPERGSAALLPDGTQIAVFLLDDGSVHAVQQKDPYSGANILSRGLVGTHEIPADGSNDAAADAEPEVVPTVASPMYKQVWNLNTGEVIDGIEPEQHRIAVFDVQVADGHVQVDPTPRSGTSTAPAAGEQK